MVDVRSNPALRQQIQSIVRRSAQASQPAAAPASAGVSPTPAMAQAPGLTPPAMSISQRLQELETLRATGAVSDAEYKAKRAQIISEI
jgi:hypothetical protein